MKLIKQLHQFQILRVLLYIEWQTFKCINFISTFNSRFSNQANLANKLVHEFIIGPFLTHQCIEISCNLYSLNRFSERNNEMYSND